MQLSATQPLVTVNKSASAKKDSIRLTNHSPRAATLMSTCLPGLGQIYNRKYWKVPIIYGAAAGIGYAIKWNNDLYYDFRVAITQYGDNQTITTNDRIRNNVLRYEEMGADPTDYLDSGRDYYRRNRDLNIIFMAGLYVLNIIDAMVDAHFFVYDVNEDLTMNIKPATFTNYSRQNIGLSLSFNF